MNASLRKMHPTRGVTLIELMVVVAIVAILAAIGSIAYSRYLKSGKIERLRSYALEIASGQERFKGRNNKYWNGGTYSGNEDAYRNLVDFDQKVPGNVTIETEALSGDGTACSICPSGISLATDQIGFAVVVTQDLDPDATDDTTIVVTSENSQPVLLHEGE